MKQCDTQRAVIFTCTGRWRRPRTLRRYFTHVILLHRCVQICRSCHCPHRRDEGSGRREAQSPTRSHTDGTGRPWAELWRLIPRPVIPIALRHLVTTLLGRDVRLHRSRGPVPVAEGIRLFLKQAGIEHLLCASHSPGRGVHAGAHRGGKHSVPGSLRPLPRRRRTPAPPQFRKAHIILVSVKTWLYLTLLTATIKILKMRILSLNVMTTQDSKKFLPQRHPANLRKQSLLT